MYIWIFTLAFVFFAALAAFIGVMKSRKYKWQLAVSRIIIVLVSAIVAAFMTSLISSTLVNNVLKPLLGSELTFPEVEQYVPGLSISGMALVFVAMVFAMLIFIPVFWIIRAILKLFLKLLAKGMVKLTKDTTTPPPSDKKKKKKYAEFKLAKGNWISALCGAACGVLTMVIMAIPFVGFTGTVGNMILPTAKHLSLEPEVMEVVTIADEAVNNPATTIVRTAGGDVLFNVMSYCEVDSNTNTNTVKADIGTVTHLCDIALKYNVLDKVMEDPQLVLANEECTYEIFHTLIRNSKFRGTVDIISDTVVEGFMTKVNVPHTKDELYNNFMQEVQFASGADVNTLTVSYDDIFDEYGLRVDTTMSQRAANAKLNGADMVLWTNQNVVADKAAFIAKSECVVIDDIIVDRPQIKDTEHEARVLAHAVATVCSFSDDVNSSSFDVKKMINLIGPMLDSFAETETLGPVKTEYMLMGILQSKLVHDKVGLTVLGAADTAKSIYENSKTSGYVPVMGSIAHAVEVVENASSGDNSSTESVKALIENITPATSAVLQTVATPPVMQKYGVPEKSAEPVADVVSNTFKNLSSAKEEGMSEAEYEKEAVAVSNMMDVLVNADKADKRSMFGEDSITGVSATEYVNNVITSKVMSKTIVEKVYGEGTVPADDPLNSGVNLRDEEKGALLTALSDEWNASAKDDKVQKEIVSIAAIMNLKVEFTESGVREAI